MNLYIKKEKTTLEKLFADILTELPKDNVSSIATSAYANDKEGNAYKLKLTIENLKYTENKAKHRMGQAKRELENIKELQKEYKK